MKDYEIKLAQIACFKNVRAQVKNNSINAIKAEIDEKTIKEITCIIDSENENAIDIFTGNVYHILKRSNGGRIIDNPSSLKTNQYYVLYVLENKKVTDSQLYRIYCNDLANKVFTKYKKDLVTKEKKVKVKILDKRKK